MKKNMFDSNSKGNKIFSACVTLLLLLLTVMFIILNCKYDTIALLSSAITFGTVLYHFVMRLLVGFITSKYLYKFLRPDSPWFKTNPFERKIYNLLKVKKWKLFMPTADPESYSLKKHTPDEIAKTMCVSELVHELDIVFSFLPLLLAIPFGKMPVFLITSTLAALADLPFVIMQRYNRPRMLRFARKNSK